MEKDGCVIFFGFDWKLEEEGTGYLLQGKEKYIFKTGS